MLATFYSFEKGRFILLLWQAVRAALHGFLMDKSHPNFNIKPLCNALKNNMEMANKGVKAIFKLRALLNFFY